MKLKYNFAIKEVLGEYFAVSVGNADSKFDGLLSLNEIGKTIFEYIQQGLEEDTIVVKLKEEYDATEEQLRGEVEKVIQRLKEEGIVEE